MNFNFLSLFSGGGAPVIAAVGGTCTVNGQLVPCGEFAQLAATIGLSFFMMCLVLLVLIIVGTWKVFEKAGKPGWASIIPIYNVVVLLEITGYSPVLVLLMFVPFVNFVLAILLNVKLAEVFGRGAGYALGLIFLPFIFIPMLGFGSATYTRPTGAPMM